MIYVNSDQDAQNLAQLYAYRDFRIPPAARASSAGTPSRNQRGRRVVRGASNVVVGRNQLAMAHVTSPLTGGAEVADGSSSVYVTPGIFRTARVEDLTTDGSPVADGVESVLVG